MNGQNDERQQFDDAIDSAEYGKCVEISTQSAIKEMVAPGLVAILTPVAIGFGGGAVMLGGLLSRRYRIGGLNGALSVQCWRSMGQCKKDGRRGL